MLQGLIAGSGDLGSDTLQVMAAPLRGLAAASAAAGTRSAAPRPPTPSIQADLRLNALIVQDLPERMPVYERLIALLDVPSAQIEIEALIIDINLQRLEELGISWGGRNGIVALGFGNPDQALASGTLALAPGGDAQPAHRHPRRHGAPAPRGLQRRPPRRRTAPGPGPPMDPTALQQ